MNPKIVKKSVAKSVFSLGIDYIQERKKQLETEYINQLSPQINYPNHIQPA